MNTRHTTWLSIEDQELVLRQRDVNDEEYDPHWRDRLLPGNQEIYNRANAEHRRLYEEYIENTTRSIARRQEGRQDRSSTDPQGGSPDPAPGRGTRGPRALTPTRTGASQCRGSTFWSNERECYDSHRDCVCHPRRVGHPPVTAAESTALPCPQTGQPSKAGDAYRHRRDQPWRIRGRTRARCRHPARQHVRWNPTSSG